MSEKVGATAIKFFLITNERASRASAILLGGVTMGWFDFVLSWILSLFGNASSLNRIGVYYEEGRLVSPNRVLACRYFRLSASKGCAHGHMNLGRCYENGWFKKNDVLAFDHYLQAAHDKVGWACNRCGAGYESGEILPMDLDKAGEFYRMAGEAGYAGGFYNLGRLCENCGDWAEAQKWYTEAQRMGLAVDKRVDLA